MGIDFLPFWVSLKLGLWVTIILLLIGFPLAWLFARGRMKGLVALESVFSLPMVLSPTVMGFYLLVFLSPKSPIGRFFLDAFGIRLAFSFPGLVIASCVAGFPFMLSGLKPSMAALPRRLLEASYTLGKSRLETMLRVVLPSVRTGLITSVVMTFAHTLGEFGVVLMIGGSIPGATKVVSIAIFEKVESLDFASAQLYSLVLILVAYPAVFLLNYLQRAQSRSAA